MGDHFKSLENKRNWRALRWSAHPAPGHFRTAREQPSSSRLLLRITSFSKAEGVCGQLSQPISFEFICIGSNRMFTNSRNG